MRTSLCLIFLFLLVEVSAQTKSPLEGGIGFSIYQNYQTKFYSQKDLGGLLPLDLSAEGFAKQNWNNENAIIREYHLGIATMIGHSNDLRNEWLFSLNLVGQFQHYPILSASYESLSNERQIDSDTKIKSFDHNLMLVTSYSDLLMLRPTWSFRRHLNRRLNVKVDLSGAIGTPFVRGFDVTFYSGTIERTEYKGEIIKENAWYDPRGQIDGKFLQMPYYISFSVSTATGVEYRVFEHKTIFIAASGVWGKQFQLLNNPSNNFEYVGGDFKLISRF